MKRMSLISQACNEAQAFIDEGRNFGDFIHWVDQFQVNSLPELAKAGAQLDYARAFLLKIANFLTGKFQYENRHDYMVARPYALIVDPSNSCPLHCPGCLHNKVFQKKIKPDWPAGVLSREKFEKFIRSFGPYASTILFYNWGEPLLNRETPHFIKIAKSYLLNTSLSSNLSVPFDAEALVLSGLDYMILSVDGVTKDGYEKYRQGGNFDLAMANIRKLVEAKKKHNMKTPILSWQFLLFEHNSHEIDLVKEMARDLGVNEVRFARPYDVIWEPTISVAKDVDHETFVVDYEDAVAENFFDFENIAQDFQDCFQQKWQDRLHDDGKTQFTKRAGSSCQWLYSTLVMDAHGRYLPCCYVPRKDSGFSWIFGASEARQDPFNSEYYRFSRQHFVWLSELQNPGGIAPMLEKGRCATYCTACPDKSGKPLVNDDHLKRYLRNLDTFGVLTEESLDVITNWSPKS